MREPQDSRCLTVHRRENDEPEFHVPRRVWVARVKPNVDHIVVVQDAGFDPQNSPEGRRFRTMIQYARTVLDRWDLSRAPRRVTPWHTFDDCLTFLDSPGSLTSATKIAIEEFCQRIAHAIPYPYDLEYSIHISDLYGVIPSNLWWRASSGDQCAIVAIDAGLRDRRLRRFHCQRAATILLSYEARRSIPQRDLRALIARFIWASREDASWSPVTEGTEEPAVKRARTE